MLAALLDDPFTETDTGIIHTPMGGRDFSLSVSARLKEASIFEPMSAAPVVYQVGSHPMLAQCCLMPVTFLLPIS